MKAPLLFCLLIVLVPAHAHQPVMDMAPRWDDGYGFQLRHERFGSDELMQGSDRIEMRRACNNGLVECPKSC